MPPPSKVDDDHRISHREALCRSLHTRNDANQIPHTPGKTLLPGPVASLVSLAAQSTAVSLRIGTFLGSFAIDSARATTLTTLELSRAVVEGILFKAGRDVAVRSVGDYGRVEAESLLERSLAALHSTITSASFFASASFHLSSAGLTSIAAFSQNLLSTLDAILGSSESSRAVASIITIIRREFKNNDPLSEAQEKVGMTDLFVGAVGFALLQRWGRRKSEREMRELRGEETIWDVVILDNGIRADVVGTQQTDYGNEADDNLRPRRRRRGSFLHPGNMGDNEKFEAVERPPKSANSSLSSISVAAVSSTRQDQLAPEDMRRFILDQLPPGARVSIRLDTVMTRTITVDVFDSVVDLTAPPGTSMIEERLHHYPPRHLQQHSIRDDLPASLLDFSSNLPTQTIVFQASLGRSRSVDQHPAIDDPRSRHRSLERGKPLLQGSEEMVNSDVLVACSSSLSRGMDGTPEDGFSQPNLNEQRSPRRGSTSSTTSETERTFTKSPSAKILSTQQRTRKSNIDETLGRKLMQLKKIPKDVVGSITYQKPDKENVPPNKRQLNENVKKHLTKWKQTEALLDRSEQNANSVEASNENSIHDAHSRITGSIVKNDVSTRSKCRSGTTRYQLTETSSTDPLGTHREAASMDDPRKDPRKHHFRSRSALSVATSPKTDFSFANDGSGGPARPNLLRSVSTKSLTQSLYSFATVDSETSLVLAPRPTRSVYEDQATILALIRDGRVSGLFPADHFVKNIRRFCRFASASYGSKFLRAMGIPEVKHRWHADELDHYEHSSFSNHTGMPASTILLSSFVDPAGGSNSSGKNAQGFPLVHYLSLDHESKAVVLTLRGTWGFEDILTDMTCDYDDLHWQDRRWQVHKGMHASARRLLEGGGGRVMATIKAALEEFTDYGVIFCGHSLGGGVAALLAILISRPKDASTDAPSFVTESKTSAAKSNPPSPDNPSDIHQQPPSAFCLPPGRPIHVYAYGPPAVMSPSLRRATRGLITTVVNGKDIVPTLSLGVLRDFQAVALAFKRDSSNAKSHVRSRVWGGITQSIVNKFYVDQPPLLIQAGDGVGEDSWAWDTLTSLRSHLTSPKLLPPGEVFLVETMRVLQRDAFTMDTTTATSDAYPRLGRPATRVQLKFVRDVDSRFQEIRFGSGMFGDHSPVRYEASLASLARGVLED